MIKNFNYYTKVQENALESINLVTKNTYILLSLTIMFSALTAFISIKTDAKSVGIIYFFVISFGLLFLIETLKKSIFGLFLVFIFTGFIGFYLGPLLKPLMYTKSGQDIIFQSLFLTSINFLFLSMYVLISKKNFDFLKGLIFTGIIIIIGFTILNIFTKIILINALISSFIILLSSLIILHETSKIINGEETSYVSATVSLYLQIYNIFLSLLNLLNFFSSKD